MKLIEKNVGQNSWRLSHPQHSQGRSPCDATLPRQGLQRIERAEPAAPALVEHMRVNHPKNGSWMRPPVP
jgi:hypothetical protein